MDALGKKVELFTHRGRLDFERVECDTLKCRASRLEMEVVACVAVIV